MRQIVNISIKEYNEFVNKIYKDDINFVDTKSEVIKIITDPKSAFYNNSNIEVVGVKVSDQIVCQCIFIHNKNNTKEIMMSFFESERDKQCYVIMLVEYAKELAKKYGANKIIAGIDGHCNYSIGLLKEDVEKISFGDAYNHSYYCEYFNNIGFKERKFVSFVDELTNINFDFIRKFSKNIEQKIMFSNGLFKITKFKDTLRRYTDMSNKIFDNENHFYCYKREYQEDYELFKSLLPLLNKDSLIIATDEKGEDVGFILWYYDFYELSKNIGVKEFIEHKIFKVTPKKIKIVEIGVLPEYQNSGLALAMLNKINSINDKSKNKASIVGSSWIYDKNEKSKKLTKSFIKNPSLEFFTYELEL